MIFNSRYFFRVAQAANCVVWGEGRLCAVKRVRKPNVQAGLDAEGADSEEALEEFRVEVELMKSLDHPSICRLLQVYEDSKNLRLGKRETSKGYMGWFMARCNIVIHRIHPGLLMFMIFNVTSGEVWNYDIAVCILLTGSVDRWLVHIPVVILSQYVHRHQPGIWWWNTSRATNFSSTWWTWAICRSPRQLVWWGRSLRRWHTATNMAWCIGISNRSGPKFCWWSFIMFIPVWKK